MQASEEKFTAREAAVMCGYTDAGLQNYLDRGYLPYTPVPAGDRTWRMFTREQLIVLSVFARLTDAGIKPSEAATYIRSMEDFSKTMIGKSCADHPWLLREPQIIPFPVQGDYIHRDSINGYAQVIDLKAIRKAVDEHIASIAHTRRYIELHPDEE